LYAKEEGDTATKTRTETTTITKTKSKEKTVQKQKVKVAKPQLRKNEEFEDAPLFKLMLVSDDDYDEGHVLERMVAVCEDISLGEADRIYKGCIAAGKAMIGKYPKEQAELRLEQFLRSDPIIFCKIEEENSTEKKK